MTNTHYKNPYNDQRKEAVSAISIPQATAQDLHSKRRLNTSTPANSISSLYTQRLGGGGRTYGYSPQF